MSTKARFQVYPELHSPIPPTATRWRWRFIASNGKIMADGGEAYASAANAKRAARQFVWLVGGCIAGDRIETLRG